MASTQASRRREAITTWAAAAGIAFSALFYLLDLASTLSTLHAYFLYEYKCPHAPPSSPLPRHDALCRAVSSGSRLHNYGFIFWYGVYHMLVAHLATSFIFWILLSPCQHPLRLAYFLPLIHLYRLLKLLLCSFSFTRLSEFIKSQRELNGLYDALGVTLQTCPRVVDQLAITVSLGRYYTGSSNLSEQAQEIPKVLLISLMTSIISGTYSSVMAMFCTLGNRMSFFTRLAVSIIFGVQVIATLLAKGVGDAAFVLYQSRAGLSTLGLVLIVVQFMMSLLFSCFVVRFHYHTRTKNSTWLQLVYSFGIALISRVTGPIYILTKLNATLFLFFWGATLHLIGLMIGPALVFFWPLGIKPPCHALGSIKGIHGQENKYLTCSLYIGMTIATLCTFILTTFLLIWVHKQANKKENKLLPTFGQFSHPLHGYNARFPDASIQNKLLPTNLRDMSRINGLSPLQHIAPKLVYSRSRPFLQDKFIHTFFDHLVILLTILCVRMLAKCTVHMLK